MKKELMILDSEDREGIIAMHMYMTYNLTLEDIGNRMGISRTTVAVRLNRLGVKTCPHFYMPTYGPDCGKLSQYKLNEEQYRMAFNRYKGQRDNFRNYFVLKVERKAKIISIVQKISAAWRNFWKKLDNIIPV
jgi:hypothetical protein